MTFLCPQGSVAASASHMRHRSILTNSFTDLNVALKFIPINRSLLAPLQVPVYAMLVQTAEVSVCICRPIVHVVWSKVVHIDILFVYI